MPSLSVLSYYGLFALVSSDCYLKTQTHCHLPSISLVLYFDLSNHMRILFFTLIISILSGCAVPRAPYFVPQDSPTAMVRYVTNTGDNTWIDNIDLASCPDKAIFRSVTKGTSEDWIFGDELEVSKLNMYGTSQKPETRIREFLVAADQSFYFRVQARRVATEGTSGYSCAVSGVFTPSPNKQYEFIWNIDRRANQCTVRLFDLSLDDQGQIRRQSNGTLRSFNIATNKGYKAEDFCRYRFSTLGGRL